MLSSKYGYVEWNTTLSFCWNWYDVIIMIFESFLFYAIDEIGYGFNMSFIPGIMNHVASW